MTRLKIVSSPLGGLSVSKTPAKGTKKPAARAKKPKGPPTLYVKGMAESEIYWLKTKAAKFRVPIREVLGLVLREAKMNDKAVDEALRAIYE